MKRDMNLVREILLFVEGCTQYGGPGVVEIAGREPADVEYHVKLLHQAGLLEVMGPGSIYGAGWTVLGLTWEGHEFIDAARSATTWRKALEMFQTAGVGAAKELLLPLLLSLGKQQLGITS